MKILIISDTHRDLFNAKRVIKKIKRKVDFIIHLGDYVTDVQDLKYEFNDIAFEMVAGNCDFGSTEPKDKIITVCNKKIFLTHGHRYGVKCGYDRFYEMLEQNNLDIILFGHTHIPYEEKIGDKLIFNPGSISSPRGHKGCTYGIIDINGQGKIENTIIEIKNTFF